MLRLLVNNKDVELYSHAPVNLRFQYNNVEQIQNPQGNFSQTFRVPLTGKNRGVFGDLDEPSVVSSLNLQRRLSADLYDDSIPIASGFVQVKAIYNTNEVYGEVELAFFSGALDLKTELQGRLLSDLDLSAYSHEVNRTNWASSLLGLLFSGDIRYGLIDKGFNWSVPDNPPWTESEGIWVGEFTPFIRAKALIDQIFEDAGLTYTSDFFDTADFENIYLPAYNGALAPVSDDESDNRAGVGMQNTVSGATSSPTVVPLLDNIPAAYDASNNFNNTTYQYTAPSDLYASVRINICYKFYGAGNLKVYLYKNGSLYATLLDESYISTDFRFLTVTFAGNVDNGSTVRPGILLDDSDTLEMRYEMTTNVDLRGGNLFGNSFTTSMEVFETSPALTGFDVDMSENMPEIKQMDFLTSLQKMFNLVFIPSGIDNDFIIEPYDDYFDSGDEYDWSNKVLTDKAQTIRPTTDLQFKEYQWTYRDGLDFISDSVEKSLNRVYGAYRVIDPDNDFATGEKKVETSTGNYILSLLPGTGFPIHRSLRSDGSRIEKPLAMLAYWCGVNQTLGEYYPRNDDGTTGAATDDFPLFSPYSDNAPTLTDNDLNFGMESSFVPQECNPLNTLYYKYWRNYTRELYASDARLLECHVAFDIVDLHQWKWNNKYYHNGVYWRALSLDIDMTNLSTAKVTLIKVAQETADCADIPTSFSTSRQAVLFNGSTSGIPDYGSRQCCIKYGYTWIQSKAQSKCVPRNQQATPSNETT